jgi:hypothetical protein
MKYSAHAEALCWCAVAVLARSQRGVCVSGDGGDVLRESPSPSLPGRAVALSHDHEMRRQSEAKGKRENGKRKKRKSEEKNAKKNKKKTKKKCVTSGTRTHELAHGNLSAAP